jgi:CheY-like chemotaxis protein
LRRLFVQSARDLVAQADHQGKPTASAGSEADVPRGGEAQPVPTQAKAENTRLDADGPALKNHDVEALFDLITPFANQPAAASGPGPLPTARILLADDVDVNREIARAMLEASGYSVDVAASGAEAVAAVRETPYGLVLMAVQMPAMDGLAATRAIRALPPPRRDVPVVGMSASALPSQVAAFREAGMNDHVGKPFRREDLAAAVERWRRLDPPESEPEPDVSLQALDRDVYDSLLDLVGRERAMTLLDRLAAQLAERFAGEPASDGDRARLAGDAHAMISAAGVLGFPALSGACQSLEAAFAAGEDIGTHLDRVRASRAVALKAIAALKQAA